MVDLDDERIGKIADVISNKTTKKIINLLAEKESSEGEIAEQLKLPMNTIGYNVKKLEEVGLIEKTGGFLWSVKGKRVHKYRLANKKIVITPRSILKGIIPTAIVTLLVSLGIGSYFGFINNSKVSMAFSQAASDATTRGAGGALMASAPKAAESANVMNSALSTTAEQVVNNSGNFGAWAWFLLGAWCALLIFVLWSVYRRDK
jgi:DNA-binding transcriptional ArsR family regulator